MGEFVKVVGKDIWMRLPCPEAIRDVEEWVERFYDGGCFFTVNTYESGENIVYRIYPSYSNSRKVASQLGSILARYSMKKTIKKAK